MALAWALRDRRVTSVLVGASSVAQLDDSLGAVKKLAFTDAELAAIDRHAVEAGINLWKTSSDTEVGTMSSTPPETTSRARPTGCASRSRRSCRPATPASVHIMHRPVVLLTMRGAEDRADPARCRSCASSTRACMPRSRARAAPPSTRSGTTTSGPTPRSPSRTDPVLVRGAREIDGAERAQWWPRCVAAYPPYADYQAKTARVIPVFVLEPAS